MGNRLTKIYTRTGDNGTTGLADGSRVAKSDVRFDAMGALDLLNAQLGMVRSLLADKPKFDDSLSMIQHVLFNLGGELAMPEYIGVTADHVTALETQIDTWNADLPPLKDFILPAGSVACCQVHIARATARDAERVLVRLQTRDGDVSAAGLQFINRLSDYLFVLARVVSRLDGGQEVVWNTQVVTQPL